MATIINNPGEPRESSSTGVIIGLLLAVVLIGAFIIWGLPALRGNSAPPAQDGGVNVDVNLPGGGGSEGGGGAGGQAN